MQCPDRRGRKGDGQMAKRIDRLIRGFWWFWHIEYIHDRSEMGEAEIRWIYGRAHVVRTCTRCGREEITDFDNRGRGYV